MRRCAVLLWLVSTILLLAWAGCTAFNDAKLPVRDGGAALPDGTAAAPKSDAGCPVVRIDRVAPPATPAGPADQEFVLAVREISLGLDGGSLSPTFGYDLDDTCTCKPDPDSCLRPKTPDGGVQSPACDQQDGRDDATGDLLAKLSIVTKGDPSTYANDAIDAGMRGILIRVTGYNGEDNDSDVEVSFYRSAGIRDGADNPIPPTWAPDEKWSVDEQDLLNPADYKSKNPSKLAFVKNKKLVAELATSEFPFNSDAEIVLQDVAITADVTKANGLWTLENAIAVGRWPVDDALRAVMKVQDPQDSSRRLCQSNALTISLARDALCASADIRQDPKQDRGGLPCNAMSTAVGFVVVPAAFGPILKREPNDPCATTSVPECPKQ